MQAACARDGPALQQLGPHVACPSSSHVARFQHLASLRLHYVWGLWQPSVDGEDNFRYFLAQMGRFTLCGSSRVSLLSGRLDQLLR